MSNRRAGTVVIGQSGGPTAVINQSLVGIVETCRDDPTISRVLGARYGVKGILAGDFVDLAAEPRDVLERVAETPAAALGSVRKKPSTAECERALSVFRANDVRRFFYIGGNDSAETAQLIGELAGASGYELRVFHVPKTIDNDLRVTDHCPGYGSAARFVASAFIGDNLDNRSLPGVKIDVVMGRNAGFLTAAAALARRHADDGPHLVYLPEVAFDLDRFLDDVGSVNARLGRCVVAVSEGIHDAAGRLIAESDEKDSHGNVQLSGSGALGDKLAAAVKRRFGEKLRVRADTLGYLQRSFPGFSSAVDAREAREVGRVAAREAKDESVDRGSIAIRRVPGREYGVEYFVTPLESVAKVTRAMDPAFLAPTGNDVTAAWLDYVRPLAGELPATELLAAIRAAPLARGS